MKTKILFGSIFYFILLNYTHGQVSMAKQGDPYFETLKNSTLVFVKTGEAKFDQSIEQSLEDYWTMTDVLVVSKENAQQYVGSASHSLLSVISLSMTSSNMSGGLFSDGLSIVTQDVNPSEVNFRNIMAYYPIRNGLSNYTEKSSLIIKGMQDIISFLATNKFKSGSAPDDYIRIQGKVYNEVTKLPKNIATKTLLVNQSDLTEKLTEKKFLKEYKGAVEFVNQESYIEIIKGDNSKYCVMDVLRWPAPFIQVHDLESKTLLFMGPGGSSYGIKASIAKYMFVHDGQVANLWGWAK